MSPDFSRNGALPAAGEAEAFLPFARPTIDEETVAAVAEVLRSGWLASGPKEAAFEAGLSRHCGNRPVRTFTSATAALEVALRVAGVGAGDEVITTAMSFAASANVILRVGARPVFVDIGLGSRNIDPLEVEAAITPRTRALLPVHYAGRPVDMDALYAIARRHGLRVIEDAAHAIGATWRGRRIDSIGDLVCFSFHPNKNITTIEGGALVLNDATEAEHAARHRFHGISRGPDGELDVVLPGGKANLPDVAAAVGLLQLRRLDEFTARRRSLAHQYLERLRTDPPLLLPELPDEGHCWHMFSPLLPLADLRITRREFIGRMAERGIGVGVHFPAIHQLTLYRGLGCAHKPLPHAERVGRETVTLPLFPAMRDADVDRVCEAVRSVIAGAAASTGRKQA